MKYEQEKAKPIKWDQRIRNEHYVIMILSKSKIEIVIHNLREKNS